MNKRVLISIIVLLAFVVVLLFTFVKGKPDRVDIAFSFPSGEKGNITLEIPRQVWVGDEYQIKAQVNMDIIPDSASPVPLVGRLESNMEEVLPRGEVRMIFDLLQPVTLEWHVRTVRRIEYPVTFWLWTEIGNQKQLLIAREFEVNARKIFGVQMTTLRFILGQIILLSLLVVFYSLVLYKKGNKKNT